MGGTRSAPFFTVLPNPYGATLDGVRTLLGLVWPAFLGSQWHRAGRFERSGELDEVFVQSVIPVATGCSRPSVILVSTTLNMACESTAATPQISYFTSNKWDVVDGADGLHAFTYKPWTPQLWLNPNNGNYYLFYAYCSGVNYYVTIIVQLQPSRGWKPLPIIRS